MAFRRTIFRMAERADIHPALKKVNTLKIFTIIYIFVEFDFLFNLLLAPFYAQ
jgi:hypothetical protein